MHSVQTCCFQNGCFQDGLFPIWPPIFDTNNSRFIAGNFITNVTTSTNTSMTLILLCIYVILTQILQSFFVLSLLSLPIHHPSLFTSLQLSSLFTFPYLLPHLLSLLLPHFFLFISSYLLLRLTHYHLHNKHRR